ncbi:MAG: hypothetical protein ACI8ZB_003156 [Desulforhopalus sp.]|jgi:hypothetical protein
MKAYKISLIQTLPGKEFEVVTALNNAFKHSKTENYFFLKALGGFDLIAFYEDTNFINDSVLEYKPFNYVTNQNEIFCFCKSENKPIPALKSCDFVGLVKFSFEFQGDSPLQVEDEFYDLLKATVREQDSIIGSLTDLLVIVARNDFQEIVSALKEIQDVAGNYTKISNFKTFSYLTINYTSLFDGRFDEVYYRDLISNKNKFDFFLNGKLNHKIDTSIFPSINITSKPKYRQKIKKYFLNNPYRVSNTLGSHDIVVRPKLYSKIDPDTHQGDFDKLVSDFENRENLETKITWADFVFDLLNFRFYYGKYLHSTNTNISYDWESGEDTYKGENSDIGSEFSYKEDEILYSTDELDKIFGERSRSVARHLMSFDRLSRDPIYQSAYDDMILYPYYMLVQASKKTDVIDQKLLLESNKSDSSVANIKYERALFARTACDALANGCELRSNGVHTNIEQRNARFSKVKGGIKKALRAIEFIPTKIFSQTTIEPWYGYVNIWEQSHVFQIEQVIYIPQRILWEPKTWWILWHECAHIFIDCDGRRDENAKSHSIMSEESPAIRAFLADKSLHSTWLSFLNEIAAEIIGYEFGFCENYQLFFSSFWKYIAAVRDSGSHMQSIEPYILRTFLVYIWSKYKERDIDSVFHKLYNDIEELHSSFLAHIKKVEICLGTNVVHKDRLIADSVGIIRELHAFIKHIEDSITKYEEFITTKNLTIQSQKEWLTDKNTKEIVSSISEGKTWDNDIKYPQAVIIGLLNYFDKNPDIDSDKEFAINLATILTFYGQQQQFINKSILPNPAKFVGLTKDQQ